MADATTPRQVISRLPSELVERLDAYAKREEISRNGAVERLLNMGLGGAARGHQPKGAPHGKPPNQGSGGKKDAPTLRVEIQVGPVTPTPGSMLKKGKAK